MFLKGGIYMNFNFKLDKHSLLLKMLENKKEELTESKKYNKYLGLF